MKILDILYIDSHFVVINKPTGLLVHRSRIAMDATEFAVQILRDQLDKKVYPVHRLDRKTSGCLIFAFSKEINKEFGILFENRKVEKLYHAIVRGYIGKEGRIDHNLTNDRGTEQNAITRYEMIEQYEINQPLGHYNTSRYSLVELIPETGRFHQLRKHMNHLRHPILGDRPHGCSKQNRMWKAEYDLMEMMLHAVSISFYHPVTGDLVEISAPYPAEFRRVLHILKEGKI